MVSASTTSLIRFFSSKRLYFNYEINTCWVVSHGMKTQVMKYYEVPEGLKYLKFNSFISTSEFQWILIIIREDASMETTNNKKKTCQNYIPLPKGKYSPSQIDQKHPFRGKIVAVGLIESARYQGCHIANSHSLIQE